MAYVVSAHWRAKEGKADRLEEVIGELLEPSRAEPGNVFYQAHRSPEDPQLFYLYEAYEAHMASEHFTRLVKEEAIPQLLDERRREFFDTLVDERGGL